MNGEVDAGTRVGSLYLLDRRIGGGGMGTVWAGRNTETGETVAVKILSDTLAQDPDLVARFLRERAALTSIRHPNLVEIRDLVVESRRIALVMELVQGADAARLLAEGGPMPLQQAARLCAGVSQALLAVHAAGIVHRDLKPANILVESDSGRPRLVDFGIAWIADNPRLTAADSVVGTPHYLAPELLMGGPVTPAVDVYSLAICFYQLISGALPFDGEHFAEILHKHLNQPPPPHPAIPPTVWSIIEAMLAKDPAQRPSMKFVSRQLTGFGGGYDPGPQPDGGPTMLIPAVEQPAAPAVLMPHQEQSPFSSLPPTPSPYAQMPAPPTPTPIPVPAAPPTPPPTPVPGPSPWDGSLGQGGYTPPPPPFGYEPAPPPTPVPGPYGYSQTPPPFGYEQPEEPKRPRKRILILGCIALVLVVGLAFGGWALTRGGGGSKPQAHSSASASATATALPKLAVHHWTLCCGQLQDATGTTTATDNGVVLNKSTAGDAAFNGKDGTQIVVDGPIIDTQQSFTMAFAMQIHGTTTTTGGRETVVEQRGTQGCAACIEFDPATGKLVFEMQSADTAGAKTTEVTALSAPDAASWYHVVASYNAQTHTMNLYIGGVLQGISHFDADWAPTGPLSIGSGLEQGQTTNWYSGNMADLWTWNRAMTPNQVTQAQS
ncbi:MAG TPA: protein kinase [Actinocrinis sp.]|jgi:serine/threonine-protein kinase